MKKQLLNEINEMKYLFGYKRGVVISEQPQVLQVLIGLKLFRQK